jgi:hydroxymethylbilane synthase
MEAGGWSDVGTMLECYDHPDDAEVLAALAPLDDPATRAAVTAERQLLATLEAGCTAPVGALAEVVEGEDGPELWLRGALGREDGVRRLSANGPVEDPVSLGMALADELLERLGGFEVQRSRVAELRAEVAPA